MFDNIGKKIKGLANTISWVGIVLSTLIALFFFYWSAEAESGGILFFGFFVWGAGTLLSWASSLGLYGFGELIDKASDTDRKIGNIEKRAYDIEVKLSSMEKRIQNIEDKVLSASPETTEENTAD